MVRIHLSLVALCALLLLFLGGCAARNLAVATDPGAAEPVAAQAMAQAPASGGNGTALNGTMPSMIDQNGTDQNGTVEQDAGDWEEEWAAEAEKEAPIQVHDPLQGWNRAMFQLNDTLYFYLIKPVSRTYGLFIPEAIRVGVRNIFTNLAYPVRVVNALLQGQGAKVARETGRFALNTTFGFLGLVKISDRFPELAVPAEDTGQTLGVWGVGEGPYIVWPVLGASTARDTVGLVGDWFLDPVNYVNPAELGWGIKAEDRVNTTSLRIGEYEQIKEKSLDPYLAVRDGYMQHRRSAVKE